VSRENGVERPKVDRSVLKNADLATNAERAIIRQKATRTKPLARRPTGEPGDA